MIIDCAKCPGRGSACDGCLMEVFFGSATSGYVTDERSMDVMAAVDVFVATSMISEEVALRAKNDVSAGQADFLGYPQNYLRAV